MTKKKEPSQQSSPADNQIPTDPQVDTNPPAPAITGFDTGAQPPIHAEVNPHDPRPTPMLMQEAIEQALAHPKEEPKHYVVDFDDFSTRNHRLDLIQRLLKIPGYKITLFTVPGESTKEWLQDIAKIPGIELALHGQHHSHLECRDWSLQKTMDILQHYEAWGCFQRIFKAPYWEITENVYEGLRRCGWGVADHEKNRERKPKDLPAYFLDPAISVHGHIGNVCENGIEEKFDYYASLRGEFHFVSEVIDEARREMEEPA